MAIKDYLNIKYTHLGPKELNERKQNQKNDERGKASN